MSCAVKALRTEEDSWLLKVQVREADIYVNMHMQRAEFVSIVTSLRVWYRMPLFFFSKIWMFLYIPTPGKFITFCVDCFYNHVTDMSIPSYNSSLDVEEYLYK